MNFKVAAHWRMFTGRGKFSKFLITSLRSRVGSKPETPEIAGIRCTRYI